jgi:preprotein translocase subunit SecE
MNKVIIFLREAREELKKVVWPTRREIVKMTTIVIGVTVVVGFYLGGLDTLFSRGVQLLIR